MRLRDALTRLANSLTGNSGDRNGLDVDRSRRTLLKTTGGSVFAAGALSGTAAAEESSLVDRRVVEDLTSEYRTMADVRDAFDRYGADMLRRLSDDGVLAEPRARAIDGFGAQGNPLAHATDVSVDVLGLRHDSNLDEPKRILTTTHRTEEGVVHLSVLPDDGASTARLDPTGGEELDPGRAETLYGFCNGDVVDTYTECGWNVCNECSEWPTWKYQRSEYLVTEFDEDGDGSADCSEADFYACKCSTGICW